MDLDLNFELELDITLKLRLIGLLGRGFGLKFGIIIDVIHSFSSTPFMQSNTNFLQQVFEYRLLSEEKEKLGTGKKGSTNGEFNFPEGITFDSKNQRVIVSDRDNHRLRMFNRHDLTHHLSVGSKGTNLGQFNYPSGLCIQPFYAIGRTGQSSDAKGKFNRPVGVCCSPDGSFSVAEHGNHRVQRFDASGRFLNTFGSEGKNEDQFQYPQDICHLHHHFAPLSSASSLLLVTDYNNNRLSIWSADGHQHIANIQTKDHPHGVCVDLNGFVNVPCSSSHVVCIYDPRKSYQLLQTLGDEDGSAPGQFNWPTGMCG